MKKVLTAAAILTGLSFVCAGVVGLPNWTAMFVPIVFVLFTALIEIPLTILKKIRITAMPNKQRIVIWIGIGLVILAGVYPPWLRSTHSYNWLFARAYGTTRVDFTRLLIEWIMIGALTAGLYVAPLRPRWNRSKKHTGSMPIWAFREMVGLPPDPANSAAETEWNTGERRDYPEIISLKKPRPDKPASSHYPFAVELRNGEFAHFSTVAEAEYFRANHPSLLRR
jgi:hypothetical protein